MQFQQKRGCSDENSCLCVLAPRNGPGNRRKKRHPLLTHQVRVVKNQDLTDETAKPAENSRIEEGDHCDGESNADPEHESCPEKPSKIKGTTNMSTVLASSDVCAIQGQNVRTKIRASLWDMEVREILRETRHPVLPGCVANHPLYADPRTIG